MSYVLFVSFLIIVIRLHEACNNDYSSRVLRTQLSEALNLLSTLPGAGRNLFSKCFIAFFYFLLAATFTKTLSKLSEK